MPTDNEWLRLLYVQLSQGGTGGASINQSQVKAAIESAVNIDQVEALLAALNYTTRTLTNASPEYSNPSAGNYVFTVPASKRWQFISGYLSLVNSATAGNRQVGLGVGSGGSWLQLIYSKVNQVASATRQYNLSLIPSDTADTNPIAICVPPVMADTGETFNCNVSGFQPGDVLTPRLKVAEWSV